MTISRRGYLAIVLTAGLMAVLSSCSKPGVSAARPESAAQWSAANERYMSGDYLKAIADLDGLLEPGNPYEGRALPLSLALTSGVAAGYIDIAECYAAGARANKAKAVAFKRKASVYRALANHMVLQFAERARKIDQIPGGNIQLAFAPPRGNGSEPPLAAKIANGIEVEQSDEDATTTLAVERGVLMSVASAAGSANNFAKVAPLLQRGGVLVPRAIFLKSVADSLERESQLYGRRGLDDASKMTMLKNLAQNVVTDASNSRTASARPMGR